MDETGRAGGGPESGGLLRHVGQEHEEDITEAYALRADSSPERNAEEKEKIRNIQKWMQRLPEKQQQVLRLQSFEDCSMEEIAEITGLNAGNIRTLLSRARKTLKEQFYKWYGNE